MDLRKRGIEEKKKKKKNARDRVPFRVSTKTEGKLFVHAQNSTVSVGGEHRQLSKSIRFVTVRTSALNAQHVEEDSRRSTKTRAQTRLSATVDVRASDSE